MDTVRVDIAYRPLRIAWAINSDDREAFRKCVRHSQTLAGGRYNPIVLADSAEAADIIRTFRADFVVTVGESVGLTSLAAQFEHLIQPFFGDGLHYQDSGRRGRSRLLDIENLLSHHQSDALWKEHAKAGFYRASWLENDPLRDVLLIECGQFPAADELGIDYNKLVEVAVAPNALLDIPIDPANPIPIETVNQPGLAFLSQFGLTSHYSIANYRGGAGFYVGDSTSIHDLVDFWNLRAAGTSLRFYDPAHAARFAAVHPIQCERLSQQIAHLDDFRKRLTIFSKGELSAEERGAVVPGEPAPMLSRMSAVLWNGLNVQPFMMIFGVETALGVVATSGEHPTVSFALAKKPFDGRQWFHDQHLVASLRIFTGRFGAEQHTLSLPYIPELNEQFARKSLVSYKELRVEPERTGFVIDAHDHDLTIAALPIWDVVEAVFKHIGYKAELSNAGLMTRQLIAQMGGVDNTRVFKIPGVRRLLKQHGPHSSFTKTEALDLIASKDPNNPDAKFADHADLFIEPRPIREPLTPKMVFSHLVERGLFRIGADLKCPTCRLTSWIALDHLRQRATCELCGAAHDATRQLVEGVSKFRRTGILGLERNIQGAVPVALVLQQLSVNLSSPFSDDLTIPSVEVTPLDASAAPCELDIFGIRRGRERMEVLLGEIKDARGQIDATDIANLRRVAVAFPKSRFEAFILLAKLSPFTEPELILAADLAKDHNLILLTDKELEPYDLYSRHPEVKGQSIYGGSLPDLVQATRIIYPELSNKSDVEPNDQA